MRSPVVTALAFALAAGTALGQASDEIAKLTAAATERLRADDPKEIAWGALRAAAQRLVACEPELRGALRRLAGDRAWLARRAANGVLDALVRIDAKVPAEELEPFVHFAPAVVLAARAGDDALLLAAFRRLGRSGDAWWACGQLLANARNPEFVRDLLLVPIAIVVHVGAVTEPMPESAVYCSMDTDRGWPSYARYTFGSDARAGDFLVRDGTVPVYCARDLGSAGSCRWPEAERGERERARLRWLLDLLGPQHHLPILAPDQVSTTPWTDAAALVTFATARRTRLTAEWQRLVDACVAAKLLPPKAAAALTPPITIALVDHRPELGRSALPDMR